MVKKQTVLITGASSGIGKSAAKYFHIRGWNVAATMRSPEKERELLKLPDTLCVRLDVTDTQSIQQAIEETIQRFKSIDVIVNNAGYGLVGPFEAITPERIERQMATNVYGVMDVTRNILPFFREKKGGTIINVTSMGGRMTFPLCSIYHASKWALEGFSESLQHELRPFNIKIKIVEPGAIKTDFYHRSLDLAHNPSLTTYTGYVERATRSMQNFGETGISPESVAKIIYKAATDNNWRLRYTVGTNGLLSLRRLLPDSIFNTAIRAAVLR